MNFRQLIYSSQPFGYDSPTLNGILTDARVCNERDGITGALICRHDIYLQLLEGPEETIKATYERICRDDRHAGVKRLVTKQVDSRMFGNWAMLHDPANSVIWTRAEVSEGSHERASEKDVIKMFENIAASDTQDFSK